MHKMHILLGKLLCMCNKLYVFSTDKYAAVKKHLDKSSATLYHLRRWICILSEFGFVLYIYRGDNI